MAGDTSRHACEKYPHTSIKQQRHELRRCSYREDGEGMYLRYQLGHCICANCMQCVSFMLEHTTVDPWGGSLQDPNWNAWRWLVYAKNNARTRGFDSKDYANLEAYVKDQMAQRILVDGDHDDDDYDDDDYDVDDDDDEMGNGGKPMENPGWASFLTDSQLMEEVNYRIKKYILEDLLSNAVNNPLLSKNCSSATEQRVILDLQAMTGITEAIASSDLSLIPFVPGCVQSLHSWLEQHNGQTEIILPTRAPETQRSASAVTWKQYAHMDRSGMLMFIYFRSQC